MKKTLFGLLALGAVSSAAADSVGGYVGTDATGLYYQTDRSATSALRYSINALDLFGGGTISVGGEVTLLNDLSAQTLGSQALGAFNPYYGLGLGASASLGAVLGVTAYPHGVLGLRYNISGPVGVFVEANAGPTLDLTTGNIGLGFNLGARLGLNYQLR